MTQSGDAQRSVDQFDLVVEVARRLAREGHVIYAAYYNFQSFGSWTLEAGTAHRRFRIAWDGKEGWVTFATASLTNASAVPEWHDQEQVPLNSVATPAEIENWASLLVQKYPAAPAPD